jgi:hypothetical protein
MATKRLFVSLVLGVSVGAAHAQENQLGICDVTAQREPETVEFVVESRSDTDFVFLAKRPCTNEAVRIQRCAIIKVRNDKFQHFCRGTGRPTYYEEVDVIEYWGKRGNKPSLQ